MLSCSESFNKIYEEVEEKDPSVVPPGEVDLSNVNILPTLSDPLYSIEGTRGEPGPFEGWKDDREHWLSTRFQVFGLLTNNRVGGAADYKAAEAEAKSEAGNKRYGVLWNQKMAISDQHGHTIFYDEGGKPVQCKYNSEAKLHRYKFFMLGTDGLDSELSVTNDNRIIARMTLDGNHDIMHGFAYHTDEQYADAVRQLPSDETTRVFTEGGWDNLYNRLSGNRGLHPIFNARHLLSKFDIKVKGGNPDMDATKDFMRVFVTGVSIRAVTDVDVVVADDKWERDEYITQFSNNNLISQAGEPGIYGTTLLPNAFGETTESLPVGFSIERLRQDNEKFSALLGQPLIPDGSYWVGSTQAKSLCETVLMPPLLPNDSEEFVIRLSYRYVRMYKDSDGIYHIGPAGYQDGDPVTTDMLWQDFNEENDNVVEISLPKVQKVGDEYIPIKYEGGQKYTVVITVYGMSVVMADVVMSEKWTEGGDIVVDGYEDGH